MSKDPSFIVVAGLEPGVDRPTVIGQAASLAVNRRGAVLHILSVLPPRDSFTSIAKMIDRQKAAEAELHKELEAALKRFKRVMLPTHVHVLLGSAATEIVRFAATVGADLVVVGHSPGLALGKLVMGSVDEHVVRNAGCPVMVARDKNHPAMEPTLDTEIEAPRPQWWLAERHSRPHTFGYAAPDQSSVAPWGFH